MTHLSFESTALPAVVDRIARSIAVSNHANQTYICAAKTKDIQVLLNEVVRVHPEIKLPEVTFAGR